MTLIGLITAIFVSLFWYQNVSSFLITKLQWNETLSNILSFIIIFVLVILSFRILETVLSRITTLLLLNWINNLGGALFGFIRGAIIVSILFFLLNFIPLPLEIRTQISESILAKYILNSVMIIYEYIREWLPVNLQFEGEFLRELLYRNIVEV